MKRITALLLAAALLCVLTACAQQPGNTPDDEQQPNDEQQTDILPLDPADWRGHYTAFVSDNYDQLYTTCGEMISGMGFSDLDRDGTPELVIFNSGASAAMGALIFDFVDGAVVCVTDGMAGAGETDAFSPSSDVLVECNGMEDFLLVSDDAAGEEFYVLDSGNGALDFERRALLRFGCDEQNLLTIETLMSRLDTMDDTSGQLVSSQCEVSGESVTAQEYDTQHTAFFAGVRSTGFTIPGVMSWDEPTYANDYDGCMAMLAEAADNYISAVG